MKKIIGFIILLLLFPPFVFSFDDDPPAPVSELYIYNWNTTKSVYVKVIPVGYIFNGKYNNVQSSHDYRYTVEAAHRLIPSRPNFVLGGYKNLSKYDPIIGITRENRFFLSTDNSSHDNNCDSLIGIGKFRIEFWAVREDDGIPIGLLDYCNIDFSDFDYPGNGYNNNDIAINFYNDYDIKFNFGANHFPINDPCVNRELKIWQQLIGISPCTYGVNKTQNKGYFKTTTETNGLSYLYLPIKATNYNGFNQHLDYNHLFMNLFIAPSHQAFINSGETLFIEPYAMLAVTESATLTFLPNSKIFVKNKGQFCNYGTVNGNVNIVYERRGVFNYCSPFNSPYIGGNVTIEDSAIVELPDSTTITFDSSAVLTMSPHSVLKLGKLTKLVFQNGARINANNCTFASYDTTETWDGIYLTGLAYDTLKNCTFQNAVNGINITDNYNPFGSPGAVEISNCTFKNSTGTELLNYVYANNSYNVLVKGCNALKTGSAGFTTGIIAEYCPANGLVITDNNLNYVNTGISLLQSSEYIARNIITGYSNTGSGIYLDNSNGTIEYNFINNFQ